MTNLREIASLKNNSEPIVIEAKELLAVVGLTPEKIIFKREAHGKGGEYSQMYGDEELQVYLSPQEKNITTFFIRLGKGSTDPNRLTIMLDFEKEEVRFFTHDESKLSGIANQVTDKETALKIASEMAKRIALSKE